MGKGTMGETQWVREKDGKGGESSVKRGAPRGEGVGCGPEDRTRGWASSKPDLPAEQIRLFPAAKH